MPTSLKLMLLFWQAGLVDTLSLIQFCINTGSQYGALVAAFLSTSGASALTTDPATNAAVGGAVASKIAYMRAMLARGGGI